MGNGYVGVYTDTSVLVLWYPLVDKVAHLCELRFGHTTRLLGGMFSWRELFWEGVRQLCRELLRMMSPVALKLGFFV